ncbi:MAG TPA: efflux RND transporter periplasmic adaptor subunit, partial [Bauldia sp.]|nr:efflux RND transporter periplasmic adaptor subunit [Bauldia sp.]
MLAPNTEIERVLGTGQHWGWLSRNRRLLWWGGAGMVLLLLAVWLVAGSSGGTTVTYKTTPAKHGDLTIKVSATGTIEPVNQVTVGSELSGTVKSVAVDYNDRVKAGDVLAVINTDKLTAQANRAQALLTAAKAGVAEAEAGLSQSEKELARVEALVGKDFSTQQDLLTAQTNRDRAVAALASAKAQVEVANADLAANETDLAKAEIRSPIDGVVLERNIDPGQTVAASFQAPVLFSIAEDLSRMRLLVDVDEADAGSVSEHQKATFTVEAFPESRFDAEVTQLRFAPATVSGVVTYKAVLSVDNSALKLRPGMTATADIVTRQVNNALLIPNAALRYAPPATATATADNRNWLARLIPRPATTAAVPRNPALQQGERQIWVLRDGVPVAMTVTIGASDGTWTEVVKGD